MFNTYGCCCRLANPGRLIDDDDEDIYLDDDWTWNGDKRLSMPIIYLKFLKFEHVDYVNWFKQVNILHYYLLKIFQEV